MKKKVFISFAETDRNKMILLKKAIEGSKSLIPVVVEDKKEGAILLSTLVCDAIKESNYFIPILSGRSVNTQWVNQEIGFAKGLSSQVEILPIVENEIIHSLKGFIHNQIQLRYTYIADNSKSKEQASFKKCYVSLVKDLELKHLIINIDDASNKLFVQNIKKGKLLSYDGKTWLLLDGILHYTTDSSTLQRLNQLVVTKIEQISLKEFEKFREGQNIKSKGPIHAPRATVTRRPSNHW